MTEPIFNLQTNELSVSVLTPLEHSVLEAISSQYPDKSDIIRPQLVSVRVTSRQNTGAGCYTQLDPDRSLAKIICPSPICEIKIDIAGLMHGMGFVLWLKDGFLDHLEGFSFEESTSAIDFETVTFTLKKSI